MVSSNGENRVALKIADKGTNRRMDTQIIHTMHFEYVSRSTVDGLLKGKVSRAF